MGEEGVLKKRSRVERRRRRRWCRRGRVKYDLLTEPDEYRRERDEREGPR